MARLIRRTFNENADNKFTLETKIGEVTVEKVGIEQIVKWWHDKAITMGKYLAEIEIPSAERDVSRALYRLTLIFGPPQQEGNFDEYSWELILRYKGHVFYIYDHLGVEIRIGYYVPYYDLRSGDHSKEPPREIVKELEKIIEDIVYNPVEAFEYQTKF